MFIEKSNEAIAYATASEETENVSDHQLSNENDEQIIEEECGFAEEEFSPRDECNESHILSDPKRNVNKMKFKKRNKEEDETTGEWICQICNKEFSGELEHVKVTGNGIEISFYS